jgi:signal peptidase II
MFIKQIHPLQWLWLSLFVVILDQLTKVWISQTLRLYESIMVFPFFNLTLVHNTGAAFSFLASADGWQRWFLTGLASVISLVIVVWLSRLKVGDYGLAIALALILGGAIGNVTDRVIYGYVIDFLDFYYKAWHWPAFNVADSAISVGAVLLLIDAIGGNKSHD